jgi:hypothetical protein
VGTDPLLVNPAAGNLHLQSTSAAIDRGQNLVESGTLDIDSQTRIQNIIELGADEVR